MQICLVCSRIVPPVIPESDEEDEDDVHLTLKELLAEFNDKVKGDKALWNCYTSSAFEAKCQQHASSRINQSPLWCPLPLSLSLPLSARPSWTRAVSFPVLRPRTSPSVACPPCHLLWPCGRESLSWSSWRKASQDWASVSWTTRSETCPSACPQIEQTGIGCSLRISVSGWSG